MNFLSIATSVKAVSAFTSAGKAFRWRKHNAVIEALNEWWLVVEEYLLQRGLENGLGWDDYYLIFRKVYKAMTYDYDEEEAYDSVLEDWENDSGGEPTLASGKVRDAIFEVAARVSEVFRAPPPLPSLPLALQCADHSYLPRAPLSQSSPTSGRKARHRRSAASSSRTCSTRSASAGPTVRSTFGRTRRSRLAAGSSALRSRPLLRRRRRRRWRRRRS